jgi:carbamoyltransferase
MADPRSPAVRERLNRSIKGREPFRPLAPVVLRSQYSKYFFDERCADPFMLKVAQARECCLRDAPAAIHVDGTGIHS